VDLLKKAAHSFNNFQALYLLGKVYLYGPLLATGASKQEHIAWGMPAQTSRSCELGVYYMRKAALVASWGNSLRNGFDAFLERDMESALLYYSEASELGYPRGAANAAWLIQTKKADAQFLLWGAAPSQESLDDAKHSAHSTKVELKEAKQHQHQHRQQQDDEEEGSAKGERQVSSVSVTHGGSMDAMAGWLAFRHLHRAVEGSHLQDLDYDAASQLLIGDFWYYGNGGIVDVRRAVKHWALASGKGNWAVGTLSRSQASYNLGWIYELDLVPSAPGSKANESPTKVLNTFACLIPVFPLGYVVTRVLARCVGT
jgi:TPR repeat protein